MNTITNFVKKGDLYISGLFYMKRRKKYLDFLMKGITWGGSTFMSFLIPIGFIVYGVYYGEVKSIKMGISLAVVLMMSESIVHMIKWMVGRPRPYQSCHSIQALLDVNKKELMTYSFPSGHTCAAFSMAFILNTSFVNVGFLFLGMACLVGISRMYLGVHFFTDVFVGGIIAYLTFRLYTFQLMELIF